MTLLKRTAMQHLLWHSLRQVPIFNGCSRCEIYVLPLKLGKSNKWKNRVLESLKLAHFLYAQDLTNNSKYDILSVEHAEEGDNIRSAPQPELVIARS